jgi:hypothetical protein
MDWFSPENLQGNPWVFTIIFFGDFRFQLSHHPKLIECFILQVLHMEIYGFTHRIFLKFTTKSPRISPAPPAPPAPGHVSNHLHDQQHGEMASTRPLWIFQPKYGRFIAKNVAKTMPFLPPMTGNGVYHKNGC